uniref:Uncharacterized protein n=1 Tax=Glossina palpalis gambiensis TaxID=67801 RepID=A0A1B0B0L7_9MUSC
MKIGHDQSPPQSIPAELPYNVCLSEELTKIPSHENLSSGTPSPRTAPISILHTISNPEERIIRVLSTHSFIFDLNQKLDECEAYTLPFKGILRAPAALALVCTIPVKGILRALAALVLHYALPVKGILRAPGTLILRLFKEYGSS